MKLGLMVFANDSGLGAQTRRLAYLLKPDRILLINSESFSKNRTQHKDWYSNFNGYFVNGLPSNHQLNIFINGLTHLLICETALNPILFQLCINKGIKLFIQTNYEFCDHLNRNIALPYKFVMPSFWHLKTMTAKFGEDKVTYLPPPIDINEFKNARETNLARKGKLKLLHIVGTLAVNDRNGTLDLLSALKYAKSDFELIIRSQHELPGEYYTGDKRVKYIIENEPNQEKLYTDFDALILPRRYGGLCLSCNEALMSALPVIMTDIIPNNKLLPKNWLVKAKLKTSFFTRTNVNVYSANPRSLAKKIDSLSSENLTDMKLEAFDIAYNNFSFKVLREKYNNLWLQ